LFPLPIFVRKDGGRVVTKDVGQDTRLCKSGDTEVLYGAALGQRYRDNLACFDQHARGEAGHVPAHGAPD